MVGMSERDRRLSIRIGARERAMLFELAEHFGLTSSDVIRMWIRRTHGELFGAPKPKQSKL